MSILVRKNEVDFCLPHLYQNMANESCATHDYPEALSLIGPLLKSKHAREGDFLAYRQLQGSLAADDTNYQVNRTTLDEGIKRYIQYPRDVFP